MSINEFEHMNNSHIMSYQMAIFTHDTDSSNDSSPAKDQGVEVSTNFLTLPREIRQKILSDIFDVLHHASKVQKSWPTLQRGSCERQLFLYSFWCFVCEAAEWLKSIFPSAVNDIEYVRVTWAGGRPYDEVLAERWTSCELMRAYADNIFASVGITRGWSL